MERAEVAVEIVKRNTFVAALEIVDRLLNCGKLVSICVRVRMQISPLVQALFRRD